MELMSIGFQVLNTNVGTLCTERCAWAKMLLYRSLFNRSGKIYCANEKFQTSATMLISFCIKMIFEIEFYLWFFDYFDRGALYKL